MKNRTHNKPRIFAVLTLLFLAGCSSLTSTTPSPGTAQISSENQYCGPLIAPPDSIWNSLSDKRRDVGRFWQFLDQKYNEPGQQRRLVVFIDGTGNNRESNSNIWKLYTLAAQHACNGQPIVPYYREGVGVDIGNRILGGIAGYGTNTRIKSAYLFLVETYRPGDQIFIFGFSRGAYIARSLNGFIEFAGLLKRTGTDRSIKADIADLYGFYRVTNDGEQRWEQRHYTATHNKARHIDTYRCNPAVIAIEVQFPNHKPCDEKVKVTAIGVFDTVPALGISRDDFPDDHRTNLFAKAGYHALAIDEQRDDFRPLRFDSWILPEQKLEEVWFAGAHSDVGGGYTVTTEEEGDDEAPDNAGLQWISRKWMMEKFESYNLFTDEPEETRIKGEAIPQKPVLERGQLHDEFLDKQFFNQFGLHWRRPLRGDTIHCSVLKRIEIDKLPKPLKGTEKQAVYRPENLYQPGWPPLSQISKSFDLDAIRNYYKIENDRSYNCNESERHNESTLQNY